MKTYDYIIVGAGASGLMLAYRMALDTFFDDKSILILDKEKKSTNDRTWCFWETSDGCWNDILHTSWNTILFKSDTINFKESIYPYQYKMIRSSNFYAKIWNVLDGKKNIAFRQEDVISIHQKKAVGEVVTSTKTYLSAKVFSSIILDNSYIKQSKYPVLQQHFLGYFIKTKEALFDDSTVTFMDFSIPQKGNTRFMYVLPYNKFEALFEYTLFSEKRLNKEEYKLEIETYLKDIGIANYDITEIEQGAIPMTSYPFWKNNTAIILHIGTAGGWTKASTGFTFKNIEKQSKTLIHHLKTDKPLTKFHKKNRFWFYDVLLLDILQKRNDLGASIFSKMFENTKPQFIFKFLDEQTTFLEELKLFSSMPKRLFFRALLRNLY